MIELKSTDSHCGSLLTISAMHTNTLAHVQTTGGRPLPFVINFLLLLGDRLILPVKTAFAPVAENRSQEENSICSLKLGPQWGNVQAKSGAMTYTTVQLHSTGLVYDLF